jgi:hypothetical protein
MPANNKDDQHRQQGIPGRDGNTAVITTGHRLSAMTEPAARAPISPSGAPQDSPRRRSARAPYCGEAGQRRRWWAACSEYATTTRALLELADRLRCQGVTLVVMEATSSYWKPPFYLLEAEGFECWLLNARHVKNVPGRPKTDKLDSVWLAKVAERGMCAPSLAHPKPIRQLRDLTRHRRTLIRERAREKQRLEKIIEDAQIKLSAVVSDLFGVSGRAMIEALIAGQRSPWAAAAKTRHRRHRQHHPHHRLPPALRPHRPLHRPGARLLRQQGRTRTPHPQPHPPARTPHRQKVALKEEAA